MNGASRQSAFVISIDFELAWGVRDRADLDAYKQNLFGAREAVPALLRLFAEYQVHATWAAVGFLFCDSRQEAVAASPAMLPQYRDRALFPYDELPQRGRNEAEDPLHFAPSLLRMIQAAPNQEIATHTFSHFYCLEETQSVEAFRADLAAARRVASKFGVELRSLVFPRNQYAPAYLRAAADSGIVAFRGTQDSWIHSSRPSSDETMLRRGLRFLDSYLPMTAANGSGHSHDEFGLINVPASAFLRPFSGAVGGMELLRLKRITDAMDRSAQTGGTFHLWWHPHNFGVNLNENLNFLEKILRHARMLETQYGMQSLTMAEAAARVLPAEHEVAV